jgi:hypothetical protein
MITSNLVTSTSLAVAQKVFTSTTTGAAVGVGGATAQVNAITTMILCNTGTPDPTDETADSVNVNIYLVQSGDTYSATNQIVSSLTIPAGETVFFSDEKIILDGADEIWISSDDTTGALVSCTVSTLPV